MHICQILRVVFESTSHFPFKFCNFAFLTWNIIYFGQRSQLKSNCFRFSSARVKIVKFLSFEMTSQHFSIFALFFIVMTHNSSANFKVIPFLLWMKGSHQSPNFDTFKCSGKNLPNFSNLFFKPQVSFSSKFASLFIVTKDNSSVLL